MVLSQVNLVIRHNLSLSCHQANLLNWGSLVSFINQVNLFNQENLFSQANLFNQDSLHSQVNLFNQDNLHNLLTLLSHCSILCHSQINLCT